DLASNLDVIFNAQDDAGVFLWETLRNNFYYSAINVHKVAEDFIDIDRAMVWGFNWKLGRYKLWDLMGYESVKSSMKEELGQLPDWIEQRNESFYAKGESIEHVTPVTAYIDKAIWDRSDSNLSVANKDQL